MYSKLYRIEKTFLILLFLNKRITRKFEIFNSQNARIDEISHLVRYVSLAFWTAEKEQLNLTAQKSAHVGRKEPKIFNLALATSST